MLDGGSKNLYCTRLVFSRSCVCTVINGKDLVRLRCIKGRKEEKCEAFSPSLTGTFVPIKLPCHIPLRE